jgi:hypothetical protein
MEGNKSNRLFGGYPATSGGLLGGLFSNGGLGDGGLFGGREKTEQPKYTPREWFKFTLDLIKKNKDNPDSILGDTTNLYDSYISNCKDIINNTIEYDNKTLAHIAAQQGDIELIRTLHKYGANFNVTNCYLQTPLFFAILNKHTECVDLLMNLETEKYIGKIEKLKTDVNRESRKRARCEEKINYLNATLSYNKKKKVELENANRKLSQENVCLKGRVQKLKKLMEKKK